MTEEFKISTAVRTGIKPFIGFFGLSGGGKTHSGLLFARGLAGPAGRIGVIDTEEGRASIFADIIPGAFRVIDLKPPFSPSRYSAATEAFRGNCDVLVVDSTSHEWNGEGGVLEMHEHALDRILGDDKNDYKKRERMNFPAWREPKKEHADFVQKILRYPVPVIFLLRAKPKITMAKGESGKTELVQSEFPEPIFDDAFIFEMTIAAEVYQAEGKSGLLRVTKRSRDEILGCLPRQGEQVGIKHGELLRNWCAAPTGGPGGKQVTMIPPEIRKLKTKLWQMTEPIHHKNAELFQKWLLDQGLISDTEDPGDISAARLAEIIEKVPAKLK